MNETIMTLDHLPLRTEAYIQSLNSKGNLRRRLLDLGFVAGNHVTAVLESPLGDPVAYSIMGSIIALRQEDASEINICTKSGETGK